MRQNIDRFDRFARIAIGLAFLGIGAADLARRDNFWGRILVVTGAAAVAGGVTAFSPGMCLMGVSTLGDEEECCEDVSNAVDASGAVDEELEVPHPRARRWRKHSRFARLCCPD